MAGDRVDVRRAIGRGAKRARRHDRVLERGPGQDLRRAQVLPHHLDDAPAGLVGHLAALRVGARDRRAAGERHAERLGDAVHRQRRAHGVAVADAGRARRHHLDELLHVDAAGRQLLARVPHHRARARQAADDDQLHAALAGVTAHLDARSWRCLAVPLAGAVRIRRWSGYRAVAVCNCVPLPPAKPRGCVRLPRVSRLCAP